MPTLIDRLRPWPTAAVVLVLALGVTAWQTRTRVLDNEALVAQRFEHAADAVMASIERGVTAVGKGFRGVRGYFIGTGPDRFTQAGYLRYLGTRDLGTEFPGLDAVGFHRRVTAAELPGFEALARSDMGPGFSIHPVPAGQAEHYVVRAVSDPVKYRAALGLDTLSVPERAEALRRAVASGELAATAPLDGGDVRLQSPGQVLQLLFLPLYRDGADVRTEAQRQAAVLGVVTGLFNLEPVVVKALAAQPGLQVGIRDVTPGAPPQVVRPLAAPAASGEQVPSLQRPLPVFGRSWVFELRATPQWLAAQDLPPPALVALAGSTASSLLALLVYLALAHRGRAALEETSRRGGVDLASALRDNQALLQTLHTHALVSMADAQGRITDANEAFCAISGYSRDELIGQNHRIINSGTHPAAFWQAMWAALAAGKPWRGQVCNRSKSGELYWVDSVIAPFLDEQGRVQRYISIRHDITALKQVQQRIAASQAQFRLLAEHAPVGVFATDAQGLWTYTNPAWQAIYDLSLAQSLGEGWAERVHPEDRAALVDAWHAAADSRSLFDSRFRVCRGDGSTVRVHALAQPVQEADGAPAGFVGTVQDVTALHAAEQALLDAHAAAEAANRAKTAFLANMSHEIRTPLNAIVGLNYLLAQRRLGAEDRELVAGMGAASQALLAIITNVLDVSKIESGELRLERRAFQPATVVAGVVAMLQRQAEDKGLALQVTVDKAAERPMLGDATRFGQIVTNLVGNAIKFTAAGQVRVALTSDDGPGDLPIDAAGQRRLTLSVEDTGIGISPAVQQALFQPFMQADASVTRRFGGTGLGLSIVAQLVALMGGQVSVSSAEGRGSRFSVHLNLPEADDALATTVPAANEPLQVLVAEDDASQRDWLMQLAGQLGWEAQAVDSGEALVETVCQRATEGQRTDALVVDWRLPGLDGLAALARLRERLAAQGQPAALPAAVVVSQHDLQSLRHAAHAELAANFLVKPFDRSGLFNAVADALAGNPLLRERLMPAVSALAAEVAWLPGVRVLLADDSELNLDVARRLLEREGATVQCCGSGEAALAHLRHDPGAWDAVLMDLQMPGLDGFETTRRIRGELGLGQLPVIALTAGALTSERHRAKAAGMDEFLSKPLVPHLLVRSLRQQIARTQGRALPIRSRAPQADTAPLPPWPELPGIDLPDVMQRLRGDAGLFHDMLRRLLREFTDLADPAQVLLLSPAALAGRAHKLAGSASIVGARDIEALSADLEARLRASTGPGLPPGAAQAVQALASALGALAASAQPLLQQQAEQAAEPASRDAARATADSTSHAGPMSNALRSGLTALADLMALHDLDAVARYRSLAPALAQQWAPADAAALAEAMDHYDFSAALALVQRQLAPGLNAPAAATES